MGFLVNTFLLYSGSLFKFRSATGQETGFKVQAADTPAFRKADDSDYSVVRCAPPVGANDAATKGWIEGTGPSGAVRCVGIQAGTTTASSSTVVALGRVMTRLSVNVSTAYSVGATIEVSAGGEVLVAAGVISAQAAGLTNLLIETPASANGPLTLTVAGAPVAGASQVYLEYSSPAA